jgi:hypothetical protein
MAGASGPVFQTALSFLFCAVGTTVKFITCFHTMTNNGAITMTATGCQHTDSTFKAVKNIIPAGHFNAEGLVVRIAAFVTSCHS